MHNCVIIIHCYIIILPVALSIVALFSLSGSLMAIHVAV